MKIREKRWRKKGLCHILMFLFVILFFGCQAAEEHTRTEQSSSVQEWKEFRSNEEKLRGKEVTWTFKVRGISETGNPVGFLDKDLKYEVAVLSPWIGFTYKDAVEMGKATRVREDDLIRVTGTLDYVSADGIVAVNPTSVENLGYSEN